MKKKVYVLTLDEVIDYEGFGTEIVGVYSSIDKARKILAERKKGGDNLIDLWSNGEVEKEWTDEPDLFCIWDDGRYTDDHVVLKITETIIVE